MEQLDENFVSTADLQRLTAEDNDLRQVQKWVQSGSWPQKSHNGKMTLKPFLERRSELTTSHGLVYWGSRVVIPQRARKTVLALLHESHRAASAMKALARSIIWYPGIDQDLERMVSQCTKCAQVSPAPPARDPVPWPETNEKWSRVHVDFAGPIDGFMLLVLVDSHSKWIEAVPLKCTSGEATTSALRSIFSRFGIPRTVVSDNGPQFVSAEFQRFCERNNIRHIFSPPYFPQANGLAERAVRTVKEGLQRLSRGSMVTRLARFLHEYRRTPGKDGCSPSQRLLGYDIRSRLDAALPPLPTPCSQSEASPFRPGQPVWFRNYGPGDKWSPGIVKATTGSRLVQVQSPGDGKDHRRHADQLRRRDPGDAATEPPAPAPASETVPPEAASAPDPALETVPPEAVPTSVPPTPRRSTRSRRSPITSLLQGERSVGERMTLHALRFTRLTEVVFVFFFYSKPPIYQDRPRRKIRQNDDDDE